MRVRKILGVLAGMYARDGSPDLISHITGAVMCEFMGKVAAWQTLSQVHPVKIV